jgi:hypothetical protein
MWEHPPLSELNHPGRIRWTQGRYNFMQEGVKLTLTKTHRSFLHAITARLRRGASRRP